MSCRAKIYSTPRSLKRAQFLAIAVLLAARRFSSGTRTGGAAATVADSITLLTHNHLRENSKVGNATACSAGFGMLTQLGWLGWQVEHDRNEFRKSMYQLDVEKVLAQHEGNIVRLFRKHSSITYMPPGKNSTERLLMGLQDWIQMLDKAWLIKVSLPPSLPLSPFPSFSPSHAQSALPCRTLQTRWRASASAAPSCCL